MRPAGPLTRASEERDDEVPDLVVGRGGEELRQRRVRIVPGVAAQRQHRGITGQLQVGGAVADHGGRPSRTCGARPDLGAHGPVEPVAGRAAGTHVRRLGEARGAVAAHDVGAAVGGLRGRHRPGGGEQEQADHRRGQDEEPGAAGRQPEPQPGDPQGLEPGVEPGRPAQDGARRRHGQGTDQRCHRDHADDQHGWGGVPMDGQQRAQAALPRSPRISTSRGQRTPAVPQLRCQRTAEPRASEAAMAGASCTV